jgi:hypothetical protein
VVALTPAQQAVARNRSIGFVFQSFNLLKRMNVLENVALPLLYAGASRRQARERAQALLQQVGLGEYGHRMPNQLSGRPAAARGHRARAGQPPPLLLADEPTGNLDTQHHRRSAGPAGPAQPRTGLTIVDRHPRGRRRRALQAPGAAEGRPHRLRRRANARAAPMNFAQLLIEAFRSLAANRLRTALTMLGIVIGIASVVLMLAWATRCACSSTRNWRCWAATSSSCGRASPPKAARAAARAKCPR